MARTAAARIEFRITPGDRATIEHAAKLEDVPVGEFVRSAARARAERVLLENPAAATVVGGAFFEELLAALDQPPIANPRLRRAAARAERIVHQR